jgi:hypothetical protein
MNLDAASNTAFSSVTVNGNLNVTSTSANAINFGSGTANANNIINLKGNLLKSGTGTFGCTGTFNSSSGLRSSSTILQRNKLKILLKAFGLSETTLWRRISAN